LCQLIGNSIIVLGHMTYAEVIQGGNNVQTSVDVNVEWFVLALEHVGYLLYNQQRIIVSLDMCNSCRNWKLQPE
jgi:hypothetical protein